MTTMSETDKILDRFAFHPATSTTGPQHNRVRELFADMARCVIGTTPPGRHQALALTALQEAMMWSNAAIACDTPPHEQGEGQVNPHSGSVITVPAAAAVK